MTEHPNTGNQSFHVRNEFAAVELRVVPYGRGTRLEVAAGRTQSLGLIDATVLEALTLLGEEELMQVVAMSTDPGSHTPNSEE